MKTHHLLLAGTLSLSACTYSSDPREGGLFGYWATGESGYQARVMNLQNQLSSVEDDNAALARRTASLQSRKSSLISQKSRLSSLRQEASGLSGGTALAGRIQQAEAGAENDPNLAARLRQLENEVQALKARQ